MVDDQDDARDVIATVLEDAGATVLQTDSVAKAMRILGSFPITIILSDVAMPRTDGYSFLQQVRSLDSPEIRRIPALAITACARQEDRERALAAGFDDYVVKPVDPAVLVQLVATLTCG